MDIEKTGRHVRWVWFLAASLLVTLPGPARSQEEREIVQKDAETFATFYSTRLDALKEAIKAKDKEQAKAIEDRIHAEECRFLTRSVWTCRQQKSLEKNAAQLAAYLESYRARPVVERVKARLAAPQAQPDVCRVVLASFERSGPAEPSVAVAAAPAAPVGAPMAPVVRIAYGESRTTKLSKRAWELQPGEEDDTVRSNRASSSWVAGAVRGLSTMASGTPRTSAADALAGDSDLSAKASGIRPRVPPRKR